MTQIDSQHAYVLVTPARNEASFIGNVIDSVLSQTVKPWCWVIVDDGSTDATKEIVRSRILGHDFIQLLCLERDGRRDFARKAFAFGEGARRAQSSPFHFIGNLDADICLPSDYYERMLSEFDEDHTLGIAGGIVYTRIGEKFLTFDKNPTSVGGAVQLFRRDCFEAIGGYMSLEYGGIDAAAEIRARMLGWKIRKFFDCKVTEMRRTGTAELNPISARVREGKRFHSLGYGLLFYLARAIYRMKDPPVVVGSLAAFYGYLKSYVKREPVQVPRDMVAFLRREQFENLKSRCKKLLSL